MDDQCDDQRDDRRDDEARRVRLGDRIGARGFLRRAVTLRPEAVHSRDAFDALGPAEA